MAVGACLLMIAGEFDLSIGSMIGFAGMCSPCPRCYFALAALARDPVRLRRLDAARRAQRLSGDAHPAALLHRHAGGLFILRGLTLALSASSPTAPWSPASATTPRTTGSPALFSGVAFQGLFRWLGQHGVVKRSTTACRSCRACRKRSLWWIALTASGVRARNALRQLDLRRGRR